MSLWTTFVRAEDKIVSLAEKAVNYLSGITEVDNSHAHLPDVKIKNVAASAATSSVATLPVHHDALRLFSNSATGGAVCQSCQYGHAPPGNMPLQNRNPIGGGTDSNFRQLAKIIGAGEGNYESYNTGTKNVPGGKVGHSYMNPPAGTVTGRTIQEIISTDSLPGTDSNRMFAVGAYQITIPTLKGAVAKMGLSGDEIFDPPMQDRIFAEYLVPKAGNGDLGRYLSGGTVTADQAQFAASHEWASIAVPSGYPTLNGIISDGTMSFYEGPANHANASSTRSLRDFLIGI